MPLRVISGSAGGLHLKSPKRHPLRPTQDRIRQVIFSSLAERIPGARVLDLFAGTGSFGIEALSRGAASATFVEKEPEAVTCLRENLEHCRLTGQVFQDDATSWLQANRGEFDLIFADPPYIKSPGMLENDLPLDKISSLLAQAGLFVWEHFADRQFGEVSQWQVIRQKSYGETGLTFLSFVDKK
jgi:16S rRNA (guanine966-N2)-methyltransferase